MRALASCVATPSDTRTLTLPSSLLSRAALQLKTFVLNEQRRHTVFPPPADIYAFSRLSKLRDVKVVVIGQDPYHGAGQAHGLSFSVRRGVQVPPSLRNVYKEIALEYPDFKPPAHGCVLATGCAWKNSRRC